MKKVVIISLFKGGRKKRDNPDSYRAITLTPVVTKLLEMISFTVESFYLLYLIFYILMYMF